MRSLADVIAFNESHRAEEMAYFGQDLFVRAEAKGSLEDKAYRDALAKNRRLSRAEGIDAVMDEHKLDALVAPTGGSPAAPATLIDLVNGDYGTGGSSTPGRRRRLPAHHVPGRLRLGLPVGLSFMGRAWSEPELIAIAYAYEQAPRHRRAPSTCVRR